MDKSSKRPPNVSIVIATHNQVEHIDSLLEELSGITRKGPFEAEVVVVDVGLTDRTRDRVRSWSEGHPVRLLACARESGVADAVLAGAREARGDVVVVMHAVLRHPPRPPRPPECIFDLVRPVLDDEVEMVVGSRYVTGGSTPGLPWPRRVISRATSWMAWPLVDVRDPMSGFFAVRRERLLQARPRAGGDRIGLEILVAGGESLRVSEIPIEVRDQQRGSLKSEAGDVLSCFGQLCSLAGGAVLSRASLRFATVGCVGMALDIACFLLLFQAGLGLAAAHITSFTAATLFDYGLNIRSFHRPPGVGGEATWMRYIRFAVVAVLALLLRGAVLGTCLRLAGWPASMAITAAAGASALVGYLGIVFFVFPSSGERRAPAARWRVAAVGLVAYLFLLRLFYLGLPDLLMEEAYYWNYAQHPALSYLDHPPMVAWLIGAGTTLLGDNEFGVRLAAFVCWAATAWFGYLTTRDLFDKSTAFRAVLLIAFLPIFFLVGFYMTPDAPLVACWAGAVFFLQRALLAQSRRAWWGVGVCMGLGMLSKYTIALLGPAALLFIFIDRRSRRWLRRPEPYAAACLALLLFSPVIIWNAQHHWASFAFQSVRRLEAAPEFGLAFLVETLLLLLTPIGLVGAAIALLPEGWGGPRLSDARNEHGQAGSTDPRRLFAAVFTLVPLSVFIAFSLRHDPKLNWAGPLWLSAVPLLAWDMILHRWTRSVGLQAWGKRLWTPTIVVTMFFYGFSFHYFTLGFPGVPYPHHFNMVGWRGLGRRVETIEDEVQRKTGAEPIIVGLDKYRLASQLAFYRTVAQRAKPDRSAREGVLKTTGQNLFGDNGLMYGRWLPASHAAGRTMVLLDDDKGDLTKPSLGKYFKHLGRTQTLIVGSQGRPIRTFYYRVGYNYQPAALKSSVSVERGGFRGSAAPAGRRG